jgi:hypothetical protein
MTPVVNGLQSQFEGQVAFIILNAAFGEGKNAFEAYKLPGHPSYVLLHPSGEVVWRAFGPQTEATLKSAIDDALASSTSN